MSTENIRPQGAEGISHPDNVAKSSLTVNDLSMNRLLLNVDDNLVCWIETSIDTLYQLEELLKSIKEIADDQRRSSPPAALGRISKLAALGSYIASDIANGADCGREQFASLIAPFRQQIGGAA